VEKNVSLDKLVAPVPAQIWKMIQIIVELAVINVPLTKYVLLVNAWIRMKY
jgi:hypothetical protein